MSVHLLKRISILTRAPPQRLLSTGHGRTQSDACRFLQSFTDANIEHCLQKWEWRDDRCFGEGGGVAYKVPTRVRHCARNAGSFSRFFRRQTPPVAICCEKSRHLGRDRYVCVPVDFEKMSEYARNAAIKTKKRKLGKSENFRKLIAMGQKGSELNTGERPEVVRYSVGTGKFTTELLMTKAPVPANKVITDNFVDKRHFVSDGGSVGFIAEHEVETVHFQDFDFACAFQKRPAINVGAMFSQQCSTGGNPPNRSKKPEKAGKKDQISVNLGKPRQAERGVAERLKEPVAMACAMIKTKLKGPEPKNVEKERKKSELELGPKRSSTATPAATCAKTSVPTSASTSPSTPKCSSSVDKSSAAKKEASSGTTWNSSTYVGRKPFILKCDPCKQPQPCKSASAGPKWVPPMPPVSAPPKCAPPPPKCAPAPPKCAPSPPKAAPATPRCLLEPPPKVPQTPPTSLLKPSTCIPEPPKCTESPPCHPPPPEAKACLCHSCSKTANSKMDKKCASELKPDCEPQAEPQAPPDPNAAAGRLEGCQLSFQQLEYERIKESEEIPQLKVETCPAEAQCSPLATQSQPGPAKSQPCGAASAAQPCSAPASQGQLCPPKVQPCGAPADDPCGKSSASQPCKEATQPCLPKDQPCGTASPAKTSPGPAAKGRSSIAESERCGTGCALQGVFPPQPDKGGAPLPCQGKQPPFAQSASQCVAEFLKKFKGECDPCQVAKQAPCPKEDPCRKDPCQGDPCKKDEDPICTIRLTLPIGNYVCKPEEADPCADPCKAAADPCGSNKQDPCKADPSKASSADPCGSTKKDPCESSKADPCAAKADPCATKVDPCAAKTDRCAAKADPCAAKADPCAGKADPCAAKADPCAAKADPCAAKSDPCATKADPCTAKADPCAAKADPCGSTKVDPCKSDPCKAVSDPCGSPKQDPCKLDPCKAQASGPSADPCGSTKIKADPCQAKLDPCDSASVDRCKKDDSCKAPADPCKDGKKSADPCGASKPDPCGATKAADPCGPAKAAKADPCGSLKADPCKTAKDDPCKAKADSPQQKVDLCTGSSSPSSSPCGSEKLNIYKDKPLYCPSPDTTKENSCQLPKTGSGKAEAVSSGSKPCESPKDDKPAVKCSVDASGGDKKDPCSFLKRVDLNAPVKTGPDCSASKKCAAEGKGASKTDDGSAKGTVAAKGETKIESDCGASKKNQTPEVKGADASKKDDAAAKGTAEKSAKPEMEGQAKDEPKKCFHLETCSSKDGKLTCNLSEKSADPLKSGDNLMCVKDKVEKQERLVPEGELVQSRGDCTKAKTYENVMVDKLKRVADYLLKQGKKDDDDDGSSGGKGGGGGGTPSAPAQKDPGFKSEQKDPRCRVDVSEPKKNCDPKLDPKDKMVAAVEDPLRSFAKVCDDVEEEKRRRKSKQGPYCDPLTGKEKLPEEPATATRQEDALVRLRNRRFDSYQQLDNVPQVINKPVSCVASAYGKQAIAPKQRKRDDMGPQQSPPPIEVPCHLRQLAKDDCVEVKEVPQFVAKAEAQPPKIQSCSAAEKHVETDLKCAAEKKECAVKLEHVSTTTICPLTTAQNKVAPRKSIPMRKADEDGYIRSQSDYIHPSRLPLKPPREIPIRKVSPKSGLLEGARGLYRSIVEALMPGKNDGPKKCRELPPPPLARLRITGSLCLNSSFDDENFGKRRSSEQWHYCRNLRE